MTLKSMTGFARTDGVHKETSWHWEARSVNGRSLELRLRLPSGFEALEIGARGLCQEKLARGNVSVTLALKRELGQMQIRLNEAALAQALAVAERAVAVTRLETARLDTLLAMRGVVESGGSGGGRGRAGGAVPRSCSRGCAVPSTSSSLRGGRKARVSRAVIAQQLAAIGGLAVRAAARAGALARSRGGAARRAARAAERRRVPGSIRSGCIRRRCCSRPRPTSARSSIA